MFHFLLLGYQIFEFHFLETSFGGTYLKLSYKKRIKHLNTSIHIPLDREKKKKWYVSESVDLNIPAIHQESSTDSPYVMTNPNTIPNNQLNEVNKRLAKYFNHRSNILRVGRKAIVTLSVRKITCIVYYQGYIAALFRTISIALFQTFFAQFSNKLII